MDNRHIDITSMGQDSIIHALSLAWPNALGGVATHYVITPMKYRNKSGWMPTTDKNGIQTLIFLWTQQRDSIQLPFAHSLDHCIQFTQNWLESLSEDTFGPQPDHDGDKQKGWRIFNESCRSIGPYHKAIIAIQPAWAIFST